MVFEKKYFKIVVIASAALIGFSNQAFTAGCDDIVLPGSGYSHTASPAKVKPCCKSCGDGKPCEGDKKPSRAAISKVEKLSLDSEIAALKTILRYSSETNADTASKRLYKIAMRTSSPVEAAGLLSYLVQHGIDGMRRKTIRALGFILSGGDADFNLSDSSEPTATPSGKYSRIPLAVRLAAAKEAFAPAIDNVRSNMEFMPPMDAPQLQRQTAGEKLSISQIVVACFHDLKTTSDLLNDSQLKLAGCYLDWKSRSI